MDVMTENNVVPKLRFGNFNNRLEAKKIDEVVTIIDSLHQTPKQYVEEGYAMIRVTDVKGELDLNDCFKVNEEAYKEFTKRYKPKFGDIVMSRVGTCGSSIILKTNNDVCLGQNTVLLNPHINSIFLHQLIKSDVIQKQVSRKVVGSTQKTLSLKDLKRFLINTPSLSEQQKIASFLSAVDEKLQQLIKKKDLLEEYKKGVMQQIFSGELRFKDEFGNNYPNWEEKKLGEVLKYYDGTHQTPKYVEKGVPFYSVEHLTANQFTKTKFISEAVFDKENRRVKLQKGDILMTRIGDIGTSRLIDWDVNASFYVSLALLKQNVSFDSAYLQQYISSVNFQKELWSRTIHVAFPKKINLGEIGKCKALFPELKEQQKIANFLSSLDNKIELVITQIENAKVFKKGLLQQMFVAA
jgi:type I restriction enzyme S subunit